MLEKINWKATVEEDSELSLDDIKVLADAINILVDEHNKLIDVINNLNNPNMLGNLLGAFTNSTTPKINNNEFSEKEEENS